MLILNENINDLLFFLSLSLVVLFFELGADFIWPSNEKADALMCFSFDDFKCRCGDAFLNA